MGPWLEVNMNIKIINNTFEMLVAFPIYGQVANVNRIRVTWNIPYIQLMIHIGVA